MTGRVLLGLLSLTMMMAFQNCSEARFEPALMQTSQNKQDAVADISSVYKIRQALNGYLQDDGSLHGAHSLEVYIPDANNTEGSISKFSILTNNQVRTQCEIDSARVSQLKALIDRAQVCELSPTPGQNTCMAMSLPDVALEGSGNHFLLNRAICQSGRVLCGGDDAVLRNLLASLALNPPEGCEVTNLPQGLVSN